MIMEVGGVHFHAALRKYVRMERYFFYVVVWLGLGCGWGKCSCGRDAYSLHYQELTHIIYSRDPCRIGM